VLIQRGKVDKMHDSDEIGAPQIEMPRYVSHKKVWALEIANADRLSCKVSFAEKGYASVTLPSDMWSRYQPVAGDFYVVYADGYKSFSPRKAFIEGYTLDAPKRRPTINELEAILREPDSPCEIMPDGSVRILAGSGSLNEKSGDATAHGLHPNVKKET
jgi:hypothetical protein